MLLKSLKLKNIRSYTDQEIQFPEGTLLLSGDIGAGKTTILLSIEFALFGILRGDLSGSSLLRNGEEKGFVELEFEINNQKITIHRKLKRSRDSVEQDSGYIIRNGMQKDATPQELKTEILELIGYPPSMLTKSKSLVYRYTVYTPQEDMKRIILDTQESRLDILRKVFDIDKYKRIRENTTAYSKSLREQCREYAGRIADLESKKKQKQEKEEQAKEIICSINEQKPKLDQAKRELEACKKTLAESEQKIKQLNENKKELEIAESHIRLKTEQSTRNAAELSRLKEEITKLEEELEGKQAENLAQKISEKQEKINAIEKELKEINAKLAAVTAKKQISRETKEKINRLNNCPTCLQEVNLIHKTTISGAEDSKIKVFDEQAEQHATEISAKEEELKILKQEKDELKDREKEAALIKLKQDNLQEKQKKAKTLLEQQEQAKQEITAISLKKTELKDKIESTREAEKEFAEKKQEFDETSQKEREADIEHRRLADKKEFLSEIIENLQKEITEKEKAKQKLMQLHAYSSWLAEHFLKLIDTIEKQVMTLVYGEFNELFKSWFNIMIEDESIQARLDDRFTPIVHQNGYDMEIENLSGGEKTACALAYRLALNKVINNLITSIQTKQILILDEPTDGFSTEQLDKMRDVLAELNARQVIIVSHEPKIETFADHVIHIQKQEHTSTANYKY